MTTLSKRIEYEIDLGAGESVVTNTDLNWWAAEAASLETRLENFDTVEAAHRKEVLRVRMEAVKWADLHHLCSDPLKPYVCLIGREAFGTRDGLWQHKCQAAVTHVPSES